jgi:hypothetical protein
MTVDDVVAALFRVLCVHQRVNGTGADLSLAEIRLALGVTEAQLTEAIKVLRLSGDLFIAFTTRAWDRVTPGPSWRDRCEDEALAGE